MTTMMRVEIFRVEKCFDFASEGNQKYEILADPVVSMRGWRGSAPIACAQAAEGRYRLLQKKGELPENYGQNIPTLNFTECYDETDFTQIEAVTQYISVTGLVSEADFQNQVLGMRYRVPEWIIVKGKDQMRDRVFMETLMGSLDSGGPFVAGFFLRVTHTVEAEYWDAIGKFKKTDNVRIQKYVCVRGFRNFGLRNGAYEGCWQFVNSLGSEWGLYENGCGNLTFRTVNCYAVPNLILGQLV